MTRAAVRIRAKYIRTIRLLPLGIVALVISASAESPTRLAGGEWPHYHRDLRGTRYSPLAQITKDNVRDLRVACTRRSDNFGNPPELKNETTPLDDRLTAPGTIALQSSGTGRVRFRNIRIRPIGAVTARTSAAAPIGRVRVRAVLAADQTWTATISDSMCVRRHESGAEGQETTDADCTRDCVKGGSKYVLVVGETVYAIANQNHADLARFAGKPNVRVTGALAGESVTVARIE